MGRFGAASETCRAPPLAAPPPFTFSRATAVSAPSRPLNEIYSRTPRPPNPRCVARAWQISVHRDFPPRYLSSRPFLCLSLARPASCLRPSPGPCPGMGWTCPGLPAVGDGPARSPSPLFPATTLKTFREIEAKEESPRAPRLALWMPTRISL